jgi:hypothetical protein
MDELQEWIAVSELVKTLGTSENTIKRYIRRHESFLSVKQGNRGKYYVHQESVKALKYIKKLYNENLNEDEVNQHLKASGMAMVITVPTEDEQIVNMLDTMNKWNERFEQLERINQKQSEELAELKLLLQKQTEYLDQRMSERDQILMATAREIQNTKKQISSTEQKKRKWWEFWV